MKISELQHAEYNPRKISAKQLKALKKSMQEFGDLSGIVFNTQTGNIIGGHQRVKNLDPEWEIDREVGIIDTPWGKWTYREVDWDEAKEKAANLAANKHGGEWDLPKLDLILNELQDLNFDMELTGFDIKAKNCESNQDDDKVGDIQYQIIVKCSGEREQTSLIQELEGRGLICQPLIL